MSASNVAWGPNVYAPDPHYDAARHVYRLWYGGWQSRGQINDSIYLRTSSDGITWSAAYTTVLSAAQFRAGAAAKLGIPLVVAHVNDPSVTIAWNPAAALYQYTMFFTAFLRWPGTTDWINTVWSMISADGIAWTAPIQLTPGATGGSGLMIQPSQPASVLDGSGPPRTVWHVYYEDDSAPDTIWMSYLDGNRTQLARPIAVFRRPGQWTVAPALVRIGTTWRLFYNTWEDGGHADIHMATADTQNIAFSGDTSAVRNDGSIWCATLTPGVMPVTGTSPGYRLMFSAIRWSPGHTCDFTQNQIISQWRFLGR